MKFFTADQHFDAKNVMTKMGRQGGYVSSEEHDEVVLDQINTAVGKRDFLYINGDFAFRRAPYWRGRIRCKNIRFCIGNHDRPLDSQRAFGTVHQISVVKLDCGERAVNCHYPIAFWPASHHGTYHFYGHCHTQRETTLDALFPQRRSIDVGVDNAWRLLGAHRPFSESELMELLAGRTGHDPVEFYKELRGEV